MLELKNVSFSYDNKKNVLRNISGLFEKKKLYVLYGSSGCGKTTCLKLLGGILQPRSGVIEMDGEDIREFKEYYRSRKVSLVFQDFCLFPYLNAVENINIALGIQERKMSKQEILSYIKEFGINEDDALRRVSRLSGGQQQRVAVIRSLIMGTEYILADEPTGNLDEANEEMVVDVFCELSKKFGKCVIVASHSYRFAKAADILFEVREGQLMQKR